MGRGRITANLGDSRYTVEVDTGFARIGSRLATLDAQIAEVDAKLAPLEGKLAEAEEALAQARDALDDAISAYSAIMADQESTAEQQTAARKVTTDRSADVERALGEVRKAKPGVALLRVSRAQLVRDRAALGNVPTVQTFDAWCADATDDATVNQYVATVEVPGELGTILVAPGARAPVPADGKLFTRPAMTGPQAYFNAAILPGWQRHKPTYRFGTIYNISTSADTADVELDAAVSSAQTLGINAAETLTGVPVAYMSCNAAAFEEGDAVVVQFADQDWSQPRVIGFRDNPKSCGWICYGADTSAYVFSPPGDETARFNEWARIINLALVNRVRIFYRHDTGAWRELLRRGSDPARNLQFDDQRAGQLISWPYVAFRGYEQIFPDYPTPGFSYVYYAMEVGPFCDEALAGNGLNQFRVYVDGKIYIDFAVKVDGYKPPSYANEQILPTYWAATGVTRPVEFSRPIDKLTYALSAPPSPTL